ncbi:MAG: hypothetical protein LBI35_02955 [Burkholderiales bacterium]|jgi:hypothetical protein|nr:hypothetical protein [Burkholderiales bacterium]
MKNFRISLLMVALFAGLTLLAACEKKDAPPAPAPQVEAPVPVPAEQPDAAPEEAPAAPAEPQAVGSFPAECESYLAQMSECANKLSANANAADALKQQMAQSRLSWARLPDQGALGSACRQASEDFVQRAKEMGC